MSMTSSATDNAHAGDTSAPSFTVPGLSTSDGDAVAAMLQDRLVAMTDLVLTLKHIHWNVVGPTFIGVHEMLDTQYDAASLMVDEIAERIATLGSEPEGRIGLVAAQRSWKDYPLGRAIVMDHLRELDQVYDSLIADHRRCMDEVGDVDPVTEDMLIEHIGKLEQFQWFVRAHQEDGSGRLLRRGRSGAEATSPSDSGGA
jgi:starvation-inducible DNA-binding protein